MSDPNVVLVRGGIVVYRLESARLSSVVAALDAAEADIGAPLVDESERERLAAGTFGSPWVPVVALRGTTPVGYGGLVVDREPTAGPRARGDAAALAADPARAVFGALLAALRSAAAEQGVEQLQVWVRHAGEREIDVAAVEKLEVARRLAVLGRRLDELPELVVPADHEVRSFVPGQDDEGVVDVLAAAYAGTAEAGWDLDRFRERQGWSWFRAEDLLLATDRDGRIAAVHWLKRRDATTGEVYNLAVHPAAQGKRLGPAMLAAGLHHLSDIGCRDVVLWVDRANERAVALYESQGFATLWDDISFTGAAAGSARW